jgi:hypothetical protein
MLAAMSLRPQFLLACAGLALAAGGAGGAEQPDAAAIRRLVVDLDSGSRAARDAAERQLLEAGPAALAAIHAARATARGEAAFRLKGIERTLEAAAAAEAVEKGLATLAVKVRRVESIGAPPTAARVILEAAWRPPLEPLVIRLPLADVVAEGPAGEALPVTPRQAVIEPALVPGSTTVELPVKLTQPDHPLATAGLLRGTLRLWLAGRSHAFEFPLDGAGPRTQTAARATVSLDDAVVREGLLLVTARVTYDAPSEGLASHRTWLTLCLLEVVGADGRPLPRIDQTPTARSERGLTATASFRLPDGATRLPPGLRARWRLPMAIHETSFDFMVRDVSLTGSSR